MHPKEITYDDVLDTYDVTIDVEDTEDRFIEENSNSANGETNSQSVDVNELKDMKDRFHGSNIPDGTVIVREMMIGSHFRIEIA